MCLCGSVALFLAVKYWSRLRHVRVWQCGSIFGYNVLDQAETCACVAVMLTIMSWIRLRHVLVWQCGTIFGCNVLEQA